MFESIKKVFQRVRKAFEPTFRPEKLAEFTTTQPRQPTWAEWSAKDQANWVKYKLGKSFFTRRISPNQRAARISSLTHPEWLVAKKKGWL